MRYVLVTLLMITVSACSSNDASDSTESSIHKKNREGYLSKSEALAASVLNYTCEQLVRIPLSRGQGTGLDGKYREEIRYYPGYLRGDVNNDGLITIEDAKMATHRLFKLENVTCPATADVSGYPDKIGQPDGAVTSIDITTFNDYRRTQVISWPQDIICSYSCDVLNQPPGQY